MEIKDQIVDDINSNFVMLYMKGTKDMPMCGFSATMVKILNKYKVTSLNRVSIYFYNTKKDIDIFYESLLKVIKILS